MSRIDTIGHEESLREIEPSIAFCSIREAVIDFGLANAILKVAEISLRSVRLSSLRLWVGARYRVRSSAAGHFHLVPLNSMKAATRTNKIKEKACWILIGEGQQ